jgi:hypothetical protein|tara:strand:- start:5 stop:649 length:645 start_codon:yes stop_codon:yes gene_type:complete
MALSKVDFNNINVTPAASKALKWNSSANGFETGDLGGNMVLLSTVTASSSANLDFTSSIDSTYKEYQFHYTDIHPASIAQLTVNFRDGGSDFDATKTTSAFNPYHNEDGTDGSVSYREAWDLAQSTSDQIIAQELGNGNDECASGYLHLFEPSSTTFVKHFIGVTNYYQNFGKTGPFGIYYAGYCNTTSAIDGVRFKMSSGNIDAGTIKMYGIL